MAGDERKRQAIAGAVLAALLLLFVVGLWVGIRWYTSQGNGILTVAQPNGGAPTVGGGNAAARMQQAAGRLDQMARQMLVGPPVPTSRPANTLDLLVVDEKTNRPLPDMTIISAFGRRRFRGLTAVNGHVYVPMPVGTVNNFNIAVRGKRYVPKRIQWYGGNTNGQAFPTSYTMQMERGTTIGGRVVDESGQPVRDAELYISIWENESAENEYYDGNGAASYRTIRTDGEGNWKYGGVPPQCQSIEIGVTAPGYVEDMARLRAFTPQTELYKHTAVFTLAHGVDLVGTVLTPEGKPLANAMVGIGDDLDTWAPTPPPRTDAQGQFHTKLAAGKEALITVQARGYAPDMEDFTMPATAKALTIHLTPGHRLMGKILGPTSQPVVGAYAEIYSWRGKHTLAPQDFQTNAAGEFVWPDAPADPVVLYIREIPGNGPRLVSITAGKEAIIRTLPDIHIHGTVKDAQTGKPIEGAYLYAEVYVAGQFWQQSQTAAPGWFDFQQQAMDNLIFEAAAPGYEVGYSRYIKATDRDVTLDFKLKKKAAASP
ncbi:MAG TPA: carboxypeptidase-like regulatory domain-containing protein [Tepidisphaeraceae bacterium]|nr:carboxypeptidase-like regulatory domain-containing protein [Tepidisphaeraceae bacterium]